MSATIDWPAVRRRSNNLPPENIDGPALATALEAINKRTASFNKLVQKLVDHCNRNVPPENAILGLHGAAKKLAKNDSDSVSCKILALACVEALCRAPSVEMWTYLWSLAWHFSSLEHDLPKAVVTATLENINFRNHFFEIASVVVKEAIANPGRRAMSREHGVLAQLRDDWKREPRLLSLWLSLPRSGPFALSDDDGVLEILAEIDSQEFMTQLGTFDSPYPVPFALHAAGVTQSFEKWKKLFLLAPPAFDEDRRWNGSVIEPLLLGIALEQLTQARLGVWPNSSEEAIQSATSEIHTLASYIAATIAERPNAGACAERWTVWLMRSCLMGISQETRPFPTDARSRGYIELALIEALGRALPSSSWRPWTTSDADAWEHWCRRCVGTVLAASGHIPMPTANAYVDEWAISPEDWASSPGHELRERAALFTTFSMRADAYGTRLLSIPLAEADDPLEIWKRLWDTTQPLRDIIEFGDYDDQGDSGFRGVSSATDLVQLAFGIGLMMLDGAVDSSRNVRVDRQILLRTLLVELKNAAIDMIEIDRLGSRYWKEAIRHIAIRRVIWTNPTIGLKAAFDDDTSPSFSDFLREVSADTESLMFVLQMALRNGATATNIKRALSEADIDLRKHISFGSQLIEVAGKRAGIGKEQLAIARSLLDG